MTRFLVSDSLFGDSSISYMDPISGKTKEMFCDKDNVEAIKKLTTKKIIRELALHLYFNRSKVYDFLLKSNPHHITPGFKKAIARLRVSIANMYEHDDINALASYVSIHIIPDLSGKEVAPSAAKPEAERYYYLAGQLEEITHEILNSELSENNKEMSAVKTAQLAL